VPAAPPADARFGRLDVRFAGRDGRAGHPPTLVCVSIGTRAAYPDGGQNGGGQDRGPKGGGEIGGGVRVAMSTASTYPESTARAFEIAARLGFDGVEIMVSTDPVSQDPQALRRLSEHYQIPVTSIHTPCLLITQRVWTTDPWVKLTRAREVAELVGASTVVVHPPFRWQREYANQFESGLARMGEETPVVFAVENMFPWRARGREIAAYLPDWDVSNGAYAHTTLDLSHTATSHLDALALADKLGDRLAHVHLADGSGSARDEHLVPGRGTQPCDVLLGKLAADGFTGTVVIEISTRRAASPEARELDLLEALSFARLHLSPAWVSSGAGRDGKRVWVGHTDAAPDLGGVWAVPPDEIPDAGDALGGRSHEDFGTEGGR
jgi:sugar phosphate isomerase/epimerase